MNSRPTPKQSQQAAAGARAMFDRVLASWACDLLTLRRDGRCEPAWLSGSLEFAHAKAA